MDPITLATLTSGVVVLAKEAATAAEAGKAAWEKIKGLFGWKAAPDDLAGEAARKLSADPNLAAEVLKILKRDGSGGARALVGNITADKVIVIGENHGDIQM